MNNNNKNNSNNSNMNNNNMNNSNNSNSIDNRIQTGLGSSRTSRGSDKCNTRKHRFK